MSHFYKNIHVYLCCVLVVVLPALSHAAISQDPLFLTQSAAPRVLLAMSNDHQLFVKAYTDYSDIDEDGVIDTTYLDSFDYYGYFDSAKCYKYDSSDKRFEPDGSASGTNSHECSSSNQWSGNWLNWSTMTRMDVVRKVLYGGKRSTDDNSETVLERALLPQDVHSFAKVYTASSTSEMSKFTPYSKAEITVCNLTSTSSASTTTGEISTSSYPPLMQVAEGGHAQWAQSEVVQCGFRNNWDTTADNATRPTYDERIESTDLIVRVQVCVSGSEESDCKTYGSNSKPTGLIQQYGEDTSTLKMNFGLITGSYIDNTSGGILRKNVTPFIGNGNFDDEIDTSTGIFNYLDTTLSSSSIDSYAAGIVGTLDAIRIARRKGNSYHGYDGCTWSSAYSDPPCRDWGNPLSEIYLEGLRYLSGKDSSNNTISPTSAFSNDDSSYVTGLQSPPSWTDPLSATEWCADLSMITISTGLNSYDTDELSNDIAINVNDWVDKGGSAENIDGNEYYIGEGSYSSNQQCTAKTLNNLSDAVGICPEIPTMEGGYDIAGLAYYAKTQDIRPDITPADGDADQTLTTYSIALAESLPKIEIPLSNGKTITILPACKNGDETMLCSLTDMTVISMNADGTKGEIDISWEDQAWGSDYDMDAISHISFCAESACTTNPGTNKIEVTTEVRQNVTGGSMKMGYIITGSTDDGTKLPLIKGNGWPTPRQDFAYTTPPPTPNGSNVFIDTKVYSQGSSVGAFLENPLWYAAKYGAFKDDDEDGTPIESDDSEWDEDGDGQPDGFFNARNPADLFASLGTILQNIVARDSSSSTIATNSTRLNTDSKVYQARFTSGSWKGDLWAFGLDSLTGALTDANTPDWKASELILPEANRSIFTHNGTNAVEFEYANLGAKQTYINAEQVDYIRGNRSNEGVTLRSRDSILGDIINSDPLYVSSDNFNYYALELDASGFATYDDYLNGTGATDKGVRQDMIYVGANDGMLHGLRATGAVGSGGIACNVVSGDCEGEEVFAYIPKGVYNKTYDSNKGLSDLASLNYDHQYFVDGAPKMGDAYVDFDGTGERWGTALVGTLAGGGRGIFALDISNPLNFSASDVLWDLDDTDTNMGDLGYTFSQPSIVKLNSDNGTGNNDWGVIVGNGYGSANGKAVLYILGLETGEVIWKSEVETSSGANGLSTPIAIDTDGDKIADSVYAGDLQGNMWKFDISDNQVSKWAVAITHKTGPTTYNDPLYQACTDDPCTDPQPITSKPQVVTATAGGVMVLFGTGKYFETGDNSDTTQIHTYYGIHDDGSNSPIAGLSSLVQQEIVYEGAATGLDYYVRVISDYDVDYDAKDGWYINLITPTAVSNTGERVFANSLVRNGRVIFPTLIPETAACSYGGTSWLMEVDAQTGSRLSISAFDLNNDGLADNDDYVKIDTDDDGVADTWVPASGKQSTVGIIKTPTVISTGDDEKKYVSGTEGSIEVTTESGGDSLGRQSWQQLK